MKIAAGKKKGDGWAVHPFTGEKAHYWVLDFLSQNYETHLSLCGLERDTNKSVSLLNPGNFDKCKKCQKAIVP